MMVLQLFLIFLMLILIFDLFYCDKIGDYIFIGCWVEGCGVCVLG